jgi:hypothetical protein
MVEDARRPCIRSQEGSQHPDQGRLSSAIWAEHAVDAARRHAQVEPIYGDGVAERAREPNSFDRK